MRYKTLGYYGLLASALTLAVVVGPTQSTASQVDHKLASISTKMVIRDYDKGGALISKTIMHPKSDHGTIPSASATLNDHGTGGTPQTGSGSRKVTITQFGRSIAGFKLWTFRTWVTFNWYNDSKCCTPALKTVTVTDKGSWWDSNDQAWAWDGYVAEGTDFHYFDCGMNNGYPHSCAHFSKEGSFSGPAAGNPNAHVYPKNIQEVHSNSTDEWWTSS